MAPWVAVTLAPGLDERTCRAVHDHPVIDRQAAAHDAEALRHRPEHDGPSADRAVFTDDQHDPAGLVGLDGAVRDQQGLDVTGP